MFGGRLLTMRSISSPPLVGPRLGLTRDSTGPVSATRSLTGAVGVCRPCWLAGSDASTAGGIDADMPTVGFCAKEDSDCTGTERRVSLAEVPEEPLLSVRGLEVSADAHDEHLDVG